MEWGIRLLSCNWVKVDFVINQRTCLCLLYSFLLGNSWFIIAVIHVHVDGTEIPENMLNLMRNKASNHVGWTRIELRYYRLSALASFNGYQGLNW